MPVSNIEPYFSVASHGGNTYPFDFKIFDQAELVVKVDGTVKTLGLDYTVTITAEPGEGGSIIFLPGYIPAAGILTVEGERAVIVDRSTDYQEAGGFRQSVVDKDFDRLVMMAQDSKRERGVLQGLIDSAFDMIAGLATTGSALLENFSLTFKPLDIITKGPWLDARAFPSFEEAVIAASAASKALMFSVDQNLTANIVIPANVELVPLNGAKINHGAFTISYAGSTARWPLAQVFSGTGSVTLSSGSVAYPEWWGADPTGAVSSTAAFNFWAACGCKNLGVDPNATYKIKDVVLPGNSGVSIDLGYANFIADGTNGAPATCCFQVTFTAPSESMTYWMNAWSFRRATLLSGYCIDFLVINIVEKALIADVYVHDIRNKGGKQGDADPMNSLVKIIKTSTMTPESFEISHLNNNAGGWTDYMVHLFSNTNAKAISGKFHHIFQNVYDGNARVIYAENCGLTRSSFDMLYNAGGSILELSKAIGCSFSRIYQEALIVNAVVMKGLYQYCDFKQITTIREANRGGEKLFYGTLVDCVLETCEHYSSMVDATTGNTGLGSTKSITLLPGSTNNLIKDVWSTATGEGHQYWATIDDQGSNNWFGDRPVTLTYTPTITVTGATIELAAGYTLLSYRRERDMVKISGILKVGTVTGTPSGVITISLPYSCTTGNSQSTALPVSVTGFAAGMTAPASAYVDPGAKVIVLSGFAAGNLAAIGGYLQANAIIRLGGEYVAKRDLT